MRKLVYLSLTLLFTIAFLRTDAQGNAQVTQVGTLSAQNLAEIYPDSLKRKSAERALELVKNFLLSKAASGVDTTKSIAAELSDYLFKQVPAKNLLFEVISLNHVTPYKVKFSVNAYMVFQNNSDRLFQGSFDLAVDLKNSRIVFPDYSPDFTTLNYSHINFIVKKSAQKDLLPNLKAVKDLPR